MSKSLLTLWETLSINYEKEPKNSDSQSGWAKSSHLCNSEKEIDTSKRLLQV